MNEPAVEPRPFETHWRMNPTSRAVFDRAVDAATRLLDAPPDVVLDVGCGRQSNVVFLGARTVVGIDVDEDGLVANTTLTHRIIGDAGSLPIAESCADAIACIFTLEHVERPDRLVGKLARALRAGGVMVLAVPDVRSPKAVVTRRTPHSFHLWFYRRVLGRYGGQQGTPFETVLDPAIRPDRLRKLAEALDLEVMHDEGFEDNKQRQVRERVGLTGVLWSAVRRVGSAGLRHDPAVTDYVVVLRRREPVAGGPVVAALQQPL